MRFLIMNLFPDYLAKGCPQPVADCEIETVSVTVPTDLGLRNSKMVSKNMQFWAIEVGTLEQVFELFPEGVIKKDRVSGRVTVYIHRKCANRGLFLPRLLKEDPRAEEKVP